MQTVQFVNGSIYHIINRGVDKRTIFQDKTDYYRFVHNLFEFNDIEPALDHNNYAKKEIRGTCQMPEVSPRAFGFLMEKSANKKPRKLLVKLLAWCLMPNHYHFLVEQVVDGGITLFMRKLGTGYTIYFNQKHERTGVLFQGKFKAVHILDENHFLSLPFYIHGNPLDLVEPGWRRGEINNWAKAVKFLESYRFSSHVDYIGKKNFPSLTQRDFLLDVFGGQDSYKKQCYDWLKSMDNNFAKENLDFIAVAIE